MPRIDLHTHSTASPDGGMSVDDYRRMLQSGRLDCLAVTDHNRIDGAQAIHKQLGDQIIVGEEVMTTQGEIVGLFLKTVIPSGLTARQAAQAIKQQGGLVMIPHPFENRRHGLPLVVLEELHDLVDIVEVGNGRALFDNHSAAAVRWAAKYQLAGAANSDAHSRRGVGRSYSEVSERPHVQTLVSLLAAGRPHAKLAWLPSLLAPTLNRRKQR